MLLGVNEPSKLQMLIERDLAAKNIGALDDFVAQRRQRSISWRLIAEELEAATGREVTGEAVRRWYAARLQIEVKVA
jgi:Ser/Thr protein kinase RdoA (MazF antagonist)